MSDPPVPFRNITKIPKATKATPTATPGSFKKEEVSPSGQEIRQATVADHPNGEEAEVVTSLKTKKHVPLPFRLVNEFGVIGCSDKNGDKLLEYLRKAFPAVTGMSITVPFLIVLCTEIPSGPLPFTVGGLPTTFMTKNTWNPRDMLGTPAKQRKSIVTSLNFHNKDKVTDEAIQTIAEELQLLHLHPTEIGYVSGFLRLDFPNFVDPTDIPYKIAGCPVYVRFHGATIASRRMVGPFSSLEPDQLMVPAAHLS